MKKAVWTRISCSLCKWIQINEYSLKMKDEEILPKDKKILEEHLKTHEIDVKLKMDHVGHEKIKLK